MRHSTYMNNFSTAFKVLALIFIVILGVVNLANGQTDSFQDSFKGFVQGSNCYVFQNSKLIGPTKNLP